VTLTPIERTFRVMNTDALIVVHPERARHEDAERAVRVAEDRTRAIEQIFSRFIPSSELCRLNAASGTWCEVSDEMAAVLALAARLHEETAGVFDPAVLPDLERAGYDRTFDALPLERPAPAAPSGPHFTFGDAEHRSGRWRLPEGMRIDLGGIVKGWTADLLANQLASLGPSLVELGGDTAVRGVPPDLDAWEIGVQVPGAIGDLLTILEVDGGGVATSGRDRRRWRMGTESAHHLIDPRTRRPALTDLMQVTALGPSASLAEVWAKTALIVGSAASADVLAKHPDAQLLLVPENGTPVMSPGVRLARAAVVSS
jgi:thiamine biosynthesis lipoprotein